MYWRLLVCLTAVAAAAVTFEGLKLAEEAGRGHVSAARVHLVSKGQTCRDELGGVFVVSCGKSGLGDLRYHCPSGLLGRCPETAALAVRNVGTVSVHLATVSGAREGDQKTTAAPVLAPGATETLSRAPGTRYLWDIIMWKFGAKPGVIEVIDAS